MGWTVLPDDKLYFVVMDKYHKLAILVGKSTPKITYTTVQKFEEGIFYVSSVHQSDLYRIKYKIKCYIFLIKYIFKYIFVYED